MNELLSIIIPAYNIENYIGRCLDSLINQTYKNLEIIVVDDGSTDNTLSIIHEYENEDNRIVVIHKENEGVSIARLTGMKQAKGTYVGFVDGDDVVEDNMFELLMKNAIEYHADISHCGYVMDFPDGHSDYYYGTKKKIIQDNETGLRNLLEGKFIEPGLWNKIYKRELIDIFIQNQDMDYGIKNLEDLLVNYYLFKESKLSIYEDLCKYHYVLRKSSAATNVSRNKISDPLKVFKIIMADTKLDNQLYKIVYSRYVSVLINNATINPYKDLKNQSKRELKKQLKNLKKYQLSKKLKYMSFGVAYLYPIYIIVRKLYNLITGVNKKYDV